MRFWDSSALVPLLVGEEASSRIEKLAREDDGMVVWWATEVEIASALRRREREGDLSESDVEGALAGLTLLAEGWSEVLPTERMRSRAQRLLAVHPLRAADAMQLAAALAWRDDDPASAEIVCLDRNLSRAATREGFAVIPSS